MGFGWVIEEIQGCCVMIVIETETGGNDGEGFVVVVEDLWELTL